MSIDTFQLKGLQKILKITTTFVDITHTNKYVFERANETLNNDGNTNKIRAFSEIYTYKKLQLFKSLELRPHATDHVSTRLNQTSRIWFAQSRETKKQMGIGIS